MCLTNYKAATVFCGGCGHNPSPLRGAGGTVTVGGALCPPNACRTAGPNSSPQHTRGFHAASITKPTPPYTPPSLTSSISQPPRYALPPAALPQSQPHFLGSSLAQVGGLADAQLPKKSSFSPYEIPHSMNNVIGGSQILGTGGAGNYTYISTSVKSKSTSHMQPPPPYPS
ncbi:hypothetical protein C4B63_94g61 [Trypanosoma cruzi]|uniref:Uncharacterized protein n=1 Tax=Trypanosoma cruzi TaxID=5693 RepID=A0A2V2UX29_TRYCR|nr:hypothetical protein C4B63_94g61 [Trypanosoma cruzi]